MSILLARREGQIQSLNRALNNKLKQLCLFSSMQLIYVTICILSLHQSFIVEVGFGFNIHVYSLVSIHAMILLGRKGHVLSFRQKGEREMSLLHECDSLH